MNQENYDLNKIEIKEWAGMGKEEIFRRLKTGEKGLNSKTISERLIKFGKNEIVSRNQRGLFLEFWQKFANPLVIALVIISIASFFLGQSVNAGILIVMALLSVVLSFIQEHNANKNAQKLEEMVKIKIKVRRAGKDEEISIHNLVPGDIIELSAGKLVPADIKILDSRDLFINQSALNGESFPVRKTHEVVKAQSHSLYDLNSIAFMGSNIVGGFAQGVVINTGKNTEFGKLSHEITKIKTETGFDKGIKNFTWLMIRLILILAVFIFFVNAILKNDFLEALLFSLSIAIGLAPEMLPMIVIVNLSKGALDMAKKKVIIKELDSIQNFGAMDVLCTDKTGTLTINDIVLVKHCDFEGHENEEILRLAYTNSFFQSGLENLLDKAIVEHKKFVLTGTKKIDEIPFDFTRRIMSVIVKNSDKYQLISKGAPEDILAKSTFYNESGKVKKITPKIAEKLKNQYDSFSKEGFRVLAIACKNISSQKSYSASVEKELVLAGFVAFLDPPKPTTQKAIESLEKSGVKLLILSGDNEMVCEKIASEVNLPTKKILTGDQVEKMPAEKLKLAVEQTNLFARMLPLQKERVIKALQENKHIVGFLGDGINDTPSLKAADVGISVDNAVDIAKETAQIILLEKNLNVLGECVKEGRKVFANVIKYIKMGASSNFGNMLSMTAASIVLPFLPMLPTQILLNNLLYDVSQVAIPTDNVDPEYLVRPRPWNISFIKKFIFYIGPISSIFDFITFGIMWYVFHASPELFHTGWFVESLCTQILVVHIIRTNKIPFIESKPSKTLLFATIGIVLGSWLLPYSFLAKPLGFVPLPAIFFAILILMSVVYLLLVQLVKNWFCKKFGFE